VLTAAECVCVEGVTWTSRTTSAPWAGREGQTTVIDAAGAIYVIGGWGGGGTYYNDVWASPDGGAAGLAGKLGVLDGYSNGTQSSALKRVLD
jgi:hypothetical protein